MATNTIIVESNRKIAYKEELEAIAVPGIENVERQERISNNRWTTHIPAGLEVNVGDLGRPGLSGINDNNFRPVLLSVQHGLPETGIGL